MPMTQSYIIPAESGDTIKEQIKLENLENIEILEGGDSMRSSQQMPNRLLDERSPYLLQHAYNPVNWYPWGETAFQKAQKEDKPIFLSIGYS